MCRCLLVNARPTAAASQAGRFAAQQDVCEHAKADQHGNQNERVSVRLALAGGVLRQRQS